MKRGFVDYVMDFVLLPVATLILLGVVACVPFAVYDEITKDKIDWQAEAVERGYGIRHPVTGDFVWDIDYRKELVMERLIDSTRSTTTDSTERLLDAPRNY